MDTNRNTTLLLVTDAELEMLGVASAILERIADRCATEAWGRDSRALAGEPRAQDCGRLAGIAQHAADSVFDVANVAKNYGNIGSAIETFNAAVQDWRLRNERALEVIQGGNAGNDHSVRT